MPYTRYLLLLLMLLSHISSLFTSCAKNWMKRSFLPALEGEFKSIRSQMCRETFQTDTVLPPTSFLLTLFVIFTTTYLKFVTLLLRTDLTESVCCDSLNWEFLCVASNWNVQFWGFRYLRRKHHFKLRQHKLIILTHESIRWVHLLYVRCVLIFLCTRIWLRSMANNTISPCHRSFNKKLCRKPFLVV